MKKPAGIRKKYYLCTRQSPPPLLFSSENVAYQGGTFLFPIVAPAAMGFVKKWQDDPMWK